jgi:hypothetical protein
VVPAAAAQPHGQGQQCAEDRGGWEVPAEICQRPGAGGALRAWSCIYKSWLVPSRCIAWWAGGDRALGQGVSEGPGYGLWWLGRVSDGGGSATGIYRIRLCT